MQKQSFKDSYMTWTILIVLFVVFLMETALGGSQNSATLVMMGGMVKSLVLVYGQWWRLFTAQFLHIGIMHLITNVVMVYYLGIYLEQILGHWRFLAIYLASGVGGSLLSLAWSNYSISAGASTALFGLMGAMAAIGVRNRDNSAIVYLGKQAFWLAVINIIFDMFSNSNVLFGIGNGSKIDIAGHLGGLITGLLLAIILGNKQFREYSNKIRVIAVCCLVIYCVYAVHTSIGLLSVGF
ncbi:rhomboid family intramembrane serine protease [Lactobacillus sp. ESL0703]|uniref:rhomboid family intramembrane serine protease n=1 Tax=Lactobacillus sp. ESL0703 TaxID=2983218 RepID=UPI0023F6682E|nr:rhomboid family intramembrane serine protease [Lactobacillus sp. ESL0703]MDF7668091.1 rhomboid family intramembrane serine protease [Lactobacillus sp. ESL0703]